MIALMDYENACRIARWKYEGIYSFYSLDGSSECINELLNGTYYHVTDETEGLLGYFCYGRSAQVPAGDNVGAYSDCSLTDIGLGMRPDLCGNGRGLEFLNCGLKFGSEWLGAGKYRLTVAAFNLRAIRVYEKAGFRMQMSFISQSDAGDTEFITMVRPDVIVDENYDLFSM